MTELPQHPDDTGAADREAPLRARSRRVYIYWVVGIAAIGLMLVLHLTGVVGAGSH
jgi:hypothetical protein